MLDNHNAFALVSLIILVVRTTLPRSIKRVARIVSANAPLSQTAAKPGVTTKTEADYIKLVVLSSLIFRLFSETFLSFFLIEMYGIIII